MNATSLGVFPALPAPVSPFCHLVLGIGLFVLCVLVPGLVPLISLSATGELPPASPPPPLSQRPADCHAAAASPVTVHSVCLSPPCPRSALQGGGCLFSLYCDSPSGQTAISTSFWHLSHCCLLSPGSQCREQTTPDTTDYCFKQSDIFSCLKSFSPLYVV